MNQKESFRPILIPIKSFFNCPT